MNIFKIFEKLKKKYINTSPIQKIIVGLGNPTPKYFDTKHNAGFKAADKLAEVYGASFKENKKFNSLDCDCYIENTRCLILKPLTYMNNSGEAVEAAINFYKLKAKDVIVLVDDIYYEAGKIKIKKKGSAGGHNGIKSIIYETGEDCFCRIKIGVGKKPNKNYDLARWVLSEFSETEKEKMEKAYEKIAKIVELVVCEKIEEAMNRFN